MKLQFPTGALRQRLIGQGEESEPATQAFEDEDGEGGLPADSDTPMDNGEPGSVAGRGASPNGRISTGVLRTLKNYHIAAAIIMAIAWLTTLIVLLVYRFCSTPTSLIGDTSSAFRRWGGVDPPGLGMFLYDPLLFTRGLNIVIPAVIFGFVPMLIHLILAISSSVKSEGSENEPLFLWYAKYVLNNRVNPLRWIQYTFSYTFVAWIVLQLSGVTDVVALGVLVASKLVIYGSMWIFEVQNQRRSRVHWETFGLGVFLFFLFWIAAIVHFAVQMISAPSIGVTPWYFWAFVGGSLLMCLLGGLIMIIHFVSKYKQKNNANYEHWFIIHEIISIVLFSAILVVATIMAPPLP
jgi:hypothetical protein